MKLTTIALASAFVLSSTFALADTSHHKKTYKNTSGVRTHQSTAYRGTVGMGSAGQSGRSGPADGWNGPRGGLVGGADPGTYKP
jgi:hypothetical protein